MDYLNGRITKSAYDLAKASRRLGFKALPMAPRGYPTDERFLTAILSYKHVAEAAGLGTIGRHSLLITPQFGPRLRLGCLITEAELAPTPQLQDGLCNECNNCIAACPSKALSEPAGAEPYTMNKYACSIYRGAAGPCSECMRVCPAGQ
jgi:epoxyqueuosine reductase QueG